MNDIARYEVFTPEFDGERQVPRFWIAGSLKRLERRAERENAAQGTKPNIVEFFIAVAVAIVAFAAVNTLV